MSWRDRTRRLAAGSLALVLALPTVILTAAAQTTDPVAKVGRLAINFDELKDWNPTWVFSDAMKIARPWLTQIPGTLSPWDTGAPLNTDANGWPILNWGQSAAALLFREINGVYPGGTYHVFFEGSGTMEYALDAKFVKHVGPGHDEIFVTPSNTGMLVKISTSDVNNHVRNVKVILPGLQGSYQTQTFHPEFLAAIEPFGALRFMQWQNINFTDIQHWWQRTTANTWTQSGPYGMAVEHMVELANVTKKAPWFCMPHTATDDFIREFARYVAQNLDQSVPAYVEYSNEVWNNQFEAFEHAANNGLAVGYGSQYLPNWESAKVHAAWEWYADRSVQVLGIWDQEFQAVPGPPVRQRLVRVLAAQHANPDVGETIIKKNNAYQHADALAVAPYVGYSFGVSGNEWIYANKSEDQILDDLEHELQTDVYPKMIENVQIAQSHGLNLIAYEGGQHLVGVGSAQNNWQLTQKFIAVNRHPRMYDLYTHLLERWDQAGADFMTPYSFCGKFSDFGSWGHLEYLDQPLSVAHKHRALVDWAAGGTTVNPPVSAQLSYYGTACQNLWMGHYGQPKIGTSVTLSVAGAPAWSPASLMIATTKQHYQGVPLPIDLSGLGQIGCSMLVGKPILKSASGSASGYIATQLAIPNKTSLAGTKVYTQWAVTIPGFGYMGIGLSNAIEMTIGN